MVKDNAGIVSVRDNYSYGLLMPGRIFESDVEGKRYQFTGHEHDEETAYDYHGARFYNRELGRYISVDPLFSEAPDWTPYRYAFCNPVMFTDPTGMKEDTEYKDENGKTLYHSKDNLEDAVVIIKDKDLKEFDHRLKAAERDGYADSDAVNERWRNDYGPSYMVKEYWDFQETNEKAQTKLPIQESRNNLYVKGREVRIGSASETQRLVAEGGIGGSVPQGAVARIHSHENVGTGTPPSGPGPSRTDYAAHTDNNPNYYNVIVTNKQITLYNKPGSLIIKIYKSDFNKK